jgi:hypothetical protein
MRALALLLITACFASPAAAQKIYKCITPQSTVYSQTPCGDDNQSVIEVDAPEPAWPWGEGRSGSKPKPTYTCKDAQGNWTEEACKPPQPPTKPATASTPHETRRAGSTGAQNIGPEPEASGWDGVYYAVERHLKAAAHDPGSIKWEGCTKVIRSEIGWATRCDYRARNGFGALMKYKTLFIIRNDTVVAAENIQ